MYSNKTVNKELKTIISQFKDSYNMICDSSRAEYMKTLRPGAQIPREGTIYGEESKAEFDSMCSGYREKAREILDGVVSDLKVRLTDAPSAEAVNAISLLNMRKNVTREEVEDLLGRYGDNPQAWRTIASIASEHGVRGIGESATEEQYRDVLGVRNSLERTLYPSSAMAGHAESGYLSMLGAHIDQVFPAE